MTFKAYYFNGKSSKTNTAIINISPSSWRINFINDFKKNEEIIWHIDKIKRSEVYTKGLVSFSYGDSFPFQKIESNDVNFIKYISESEHKNINNKLDILLHLSVKKSILFLFAFIISFSLGMYFFMIPKVAISFAKKLPKQSVVEFGNYGFKLISHDLEIDNHKSEKLQNLVDVIQIKGEFPITAYVVKKEELNAFALSGGKFVIYSGLLEKLETEHQLTTIIGHEISHIENRHILKDVCRNLSGTLFISILFGDLNAITSIIGKNAHLFSQLSFTRDLEKEADLFGLEIMRNNNLDLDGMPELFKILNKHHQINNRSFLNTHPMLDDRIEYTQEIANKQENFLKNTIIKQKWEDLKKTL